MIQTVVFLLADAVRNKKSYSSSHPIVLTWFSRKILGHTK